MDADSHESELGPPKINWLEHMLRQLDFLSVMRERKQIRRVCREALAQYRQLESEWPHATNTERYARLVEKHGGADAPTVQRIMRRAEESFAAWPVARPLSLRDVVRYLVVTDSVQIDGAVTGWRSRVADIAPAIVAGIIPANL